MSFVAPRAGVEKRSPQAQYAAEMRAAEAAEPVIDTSSPARLGGAFLSMLAALAVAFMPMGEAQAAKSGGRMGGGGAAKPINKTTVNKTVINKTTVIQQAPPVVAPAPVVVAAPMIIAAPAPSLGDMVVGAAVQGAVSGMVSGTMNRAMGGGSGGVSNTDRVLENQQRQDERQMDKQSNQIEDLQRELAAMKK
jgi:hypothetical protein